MLQPRHARSVPTLGPVRRLVISSLVCACTVGPGGSFPDTGGNTSVSTTVAMTASTTASGGDTDDATAGDSASATDDPSSTDSDNPSTTDPSASTSDATTDTPADTSVTATDSDAESSSEDSAAGTPLDPELDIPDMGEQCDYPGDLQECPGIAVCRFATVEYGICESCDACGNLNAACVEGTDCDILFSCYAGFCTNFCTLGTFECGPVEACIDIGHPTRGVCDPFA